MADNSDTLPISRPPNQITPHYIQCQKGHLTQNYALRNLISIQWHSRGFKEQMQAAGNPNIYLLKKADYH